MHLTRRYADMVIKDDPSTRKASHSFATSIALPALSFGTLSPKKTTFTVSKMKSLELPSDFQFKCNKIVNGCVLYC